MAAHRVQNCAGILPDVGGDAKLTAGPQDAGKLGDCFARNEPALVMPFLGPWIGKKNEGSIHAGLGQQAQERPAVVGVYPDISQTFGVDGVQHLDDAILEWLAADHADFAVMTGLPDQMLAAAEAYLQPHLVNRRCKHIGGALQCVGVER